METVTVLNVPDTLNSVMPVRSLAFAAFLLIGTLSACSFEFIGPDSVPSLPPKRVSGFTAPQGMPPAKGHDKPILAFELLAEDSQIVSIDESGAILAWERSSGRGFHLAKLGYRPEQVAFKLDHSLIAAVHKGAVNIHDLPSGELRWSYPRLPTRVTTLRFQSDGEAIVCAGADGRIYRWKFLQGSDRSALKGEDRSFERYVGHTSVVSALVPHPFGRVFFSGDWHGQLFAWIPFDSDSFRGEYDENFFGGRFFSGSSTYVKALRTADAGIVSLKLTENGERLFLTTQDGWLEAWEVRGFKRIARTRAHTGLAYDFAVNGRGDRLVSTGRDGSLIVFDLVPDQRFGVVPDTSEFSFIKVRTYALPDVRLLHWIDGNHLVASTAAGKVIDITLDKIEASSAVELTPVPTAGPAGGAGMDRPDSDY